MARRPAALERPGRRVWVGCRYSLGAAGRQQCGAYPTFMAQCRQCASKPPLDYGNWRAALGHNRPLVIRSEFPPLARLG